jgi:phosphate transport system substrate-binding protein
MFSSFTDQELIEDGWDPKSVPNLDNDPSTHLWSELHPSCEAKEIIIAGPPVTSNAALLFDELVFGRSTTETFDLKRPLSLFDENYGQIADFLATNDSAIAYFDIGYILTQLDLTTFSLVSLLHEDEIIKPSAKALESGVFPLSRALYYAVLNNEADLANVRNFVDFFFSEAGDEVTKAAGFWPLAESTKLLMATRIQSDMGIAKEDIEMHCGPAGSSISIAGSSTVQPVATLWASIFSLYCDVEIIVEGGGSSNGAGRVCGDESRGTPVDIGDMSREWKDSEAIQRDGYLYECLIGDTTRSAIQIDVAIDGLTVAVSHDGDASDCIKLLGGLTTDQLRWIFSSYDESELEATGWDPKNVPFSDGDPQTHKWSELNSECANKEIRIAGPDNQSGTYEYFVETTLTDFDNGETLDIFRSGLSYFDSEDDEVIVDYIFTYPEAIAYIGYSYYYENRASLESVPIQNSEGKFVKPDTETIGDGSYNPLARRIYMNLLNSADVLQNTIPLVDFGLEHPITVSVTGYVPIPTDQAVEMRETRLYGNSVNSDNETGGLSGGAIAGIVIGTLVGVCLICVAIKMCMGKGDKGVMPK